MVTHPQEYSAARGSRSTEKSNNLTGNQTATFWHVGYIRKDTEQLKGAHGSLVVKALCYKLEGCGFDSD
jgi:hypothetical protein